MSDASKITTLRVSYRLGDRVHDLFQSYLNGRFQIVRCGESSSMPTRLIFGVPQVSVLGPILLYTADLLQLIRAHCLEPHLYADDTQIYDFFHPHPAACLVLQSRVSLCISDAAEWMRSNRLQLNADKTEIIWCKSSRRQHQIPTAPFLIGADFITPVSSVRDLGLHLDSDLYMRTHISNTVSACFAVLRQIRSIHRSVTAPVRPSVTGCIFGAHPIGLWLLDIGWFACTATQTTTVSHTFRRPVSVVGKEE